jgi:hypothetical protein
VVRPLFLDSPRFRTLTPGPRKRLAGARLTRTFTLSHRPDHMHAIEFEAHLKDGVIRLPASYRHWRDDRPVKVIVLAEDDETRQSPPLDANQRLSAILEVGRRCAAAPELDPRSADEIIGYDANGLPS